MKKSLRGAAQRRPVGSFLGLTFAFSWTVWSIGSYVGSSVDASFAAVAVGAFGPAVAAVVVTRLTDGSVRAWFRELFHWRISARWYLIAVCVPIVLYGVGAVTLVAYGATVQFDRLGWGVLLFLSALPVATLVAGGNEELGWRGFLLPRLQQRHSALTASVLVGLVWAFWHLPVYFLPLDLVDGPFSLFVPFLVLSSIVFTWLYNSTDGSVLLSMLLHGSLNAATGLFVGILVLESIPSVTLWGSRIVGVAAVAVLLLVLYDHSSLANRPRHVVDRSPARGEIDD